MRKISKLKKLDRDRATEILEDYDHYFDEFFDEINIEERKGVIYLMLLGMITKHILAYAKFIIITSKTDDIEEIKNGIDDSINRCKKTAFKMIFSKN